MYKLTRATVPHAKSLINSDSQRYFRYVTSTSMAHLSIKIVMPTKHNKYIQTVWSQFRCICSSSSSTLVAIAFWRWRLNHVLKKLKRAWAPFVVVTRSVPNNSIVKLHDLLSIWVDIIMSNIILVMLLIPVLRLVHMRWSVAATHVALAPTLPHHALYFT